CSAPLGFQVFVSVPAPLQSGCRAARSRCGLTASVARDTLHAGKSLEAHFRWTSGIRVMTTSAVEKNVRSRLLIAALLLWVVFLAYETGVRTWDLYRVA